MNKLSFQYGITDRIYIDITGEWHSKNDLHPGSGEGFEIEKAILVTTKDEIVTEKRPQYLGCGEFSLEEKRVLREVITGKEECPDILLKHYEDEIQKEAKWHIKEGR